MSLRSTSRCLLMLLLCGVCVPAAAVTLASATWSEMLQMADCVVSVRVTSVRAESSSEPGAHGIRTRVRFADVAVLQGSGANSVELLLPGGTLNNQRVSVPGTPEFRPGEQAVLFLRKGEDAGTYHLCGYEMGVLRVRDGRVIPDLTVEGGPQSSGEELRTFLSRFAASTQHPASLQALTSSPETHSVWPIVLGLACAVLLALGIARRKWRGTALVAAVCGAMLSSVFATGPHAATPESRDGFTYVLSGPKWELNTPLIDRISGGRILWFSGQTSKDLSATDAFNAITASFQQWENVSNSAVAFRSVGVSIDAGSADDQRNIISFLARPPRSAFDAKTLAITFLLGNPASNTYSDTDTVFNDRDVNWTVSGGRYSLDVVSLHEIGHIIGLAHSANVADAMYPIAQGVTQLSDSDKAGAAALYPLNTVVAITSAYACPRLGTAPLTVSFSSEGTTAGSDVALSVQWNFGDGSPVSTELNPVHVYSAPGTYTAALTIPGAPLVPPSLTLIRVLPATGNPVVKTFQYKVSLLELNHGSDKISVVLDDVDFVSGDSITLMIGGVSLNSQQTNASQIRQVEVRNIGATARAAISGRLAVKYNLLKKELSLQVTNAALGRTFDFRDPSSAAQTGTLTLPLNLLMTHADATATLYSTSVTFNFAVKSGKSSLGFIEKSIQGKKQ